MQKDEPDHATMHKQPGTSEIECNLTKANAKKIKMANAKKIKITNANILGSKEKIRPTKIPVQAMKKHDR